MAKSKTTAVDEVGRQTSKEAQDIYDAKGQAVTNYATNSVVAERASKHVNSLIAQMEMSRQNIQDKYMVLYRLWEGDSVADYFPTTRSVHVPEPFKAVEGFVPRAASLLVEQLGWFRVVGMDDAGRKNTETIKQLLLAQLKRDNFKSKFRSVLRNTAIYGDCPAKVYWKVNRRKVKYNKVVEEESTDPLEPGTKLTLKKGEEAEINEDGPTMEVVDVFDFIVDNRFHDHQRSPGVIYRSECFESDILAMKDTGHYVNVDALINNEYKREANSFAGPPGTAANPATFKEIRDMSDGVSMDIRQEKTSYRLYEIYEFWGLFDKDYEPSTGNRGREKEFVITMGRSIGGTHMAGGWTILRISENPFWHGRRPTPVAHYTRRAHSFHSVGVIEPIVNLSAELDDSRNMALAARGLASKPVIVASDDVDIYSPNLVLEPGSMIRARDVNGIKALFLPDRSDTAWKAEEVIKNDIRETTGIISTYQGSSDGASETATSVMSRTREANKRIAEAANNIAEDFLVPMLEMFHSMNQQFITKERMVELIGEDGVTTNIRKIQPEEVAGMVGFEITALPEIEVAGLKARMIEAFTDRALAAAPLIPGEIRIDELLKMSWREQFGVADFDRIFPNANAPLKTRSAMDEHYIISMGHDVDVQDNENFMAHFEAHSKMTTNPKFKSWTEDAQLRLYAHMMTTKARLEAEIEKMGPRVPEVPQPMGQVPLPTNGPQPPSPQTPGGLPPSPGVGPVNPVSQARSSAASMAPRTETEGG